jgi:hypothetical protein
MVFAFEIRAARHLGGKDLPGSAGPAAGEPAPALDQESLRIVREALEREKELQEELERRLFDSEEGKD